MPGANTWDLTPARRPGTSDFGGAAKVDDAVYPPDPTTMPTAAEYNTLCLLAVAMGRVMSSAKIAITVTGGVASVASFASAVSAVTTGTFTVTRNSAGDVSITWPAGTFPSSSMPPLATITGLTVGLIAAANIANGVRVVTSNAAGTATDYNFVVSIA